MSSKKTPKMIVMLHGMESDGLTRRCPAPGHKGPRAMKIQKFGTRKMKPTDTTRREASWCSRCRAEASRRYRAIE